MRIFNIRISITFVEMMNGYSAVSNHLYSKMCPLHDTDYFIRKSCRREVWKVGCSELTIIALPHIFGLIEFWM